MAAWGAASVSFGSALRLAGLRFIGATLACCCSRPHPPGLFDGGGDTRKPQDRRSRVMVPSGRYCDQLGQSFKTAPPGHIG